MIQLNRNMKKYWLIFTFLLISNLGFALGVQQDKIEITEQDYANSEIEMADTMRSNGKIYVVVATMTAIMGGIIVYLVALDRKVTKLEKLAESTSN